MAALGEQKQKKTQIVAFWRLNYLNYQCDIDVFKYQVFNSFSRKYIKANLVQNYW